MRKSLTLDSTKKYFNDESLRIYNKSVIVYLMSEFPEYIDSVDGLKDNYFYALPYEAIRLNKQLQEIINKRRSLAGHISEAMEQSSETWHDNAPAEALFGEMYHLDVRESGLVKAARKVIKVPYPRAEVPFATIGSRLLCSMRGDEFQIDVTGNLPLYGDEADHEEVERGSISASLPRALLGAKRGAIVELSLKTKISMVDVLEIDQTAQQHAYEVSPVEKQEPSL